jgi:uncharacterized protein YbjT (DUF2867 family)
MRLLVTGGSGFLGRFVLAEAARRGHDCVALVRSSAAERQVASLGAMPLRGDLDDGAGLGLTFAGARCDALVNLAPLGSGHAPVIIAAALGADLDRAVFVSAAAVTAALPARARAVRLAAEDSVRSSRLTWTILRPAMIYGAPGDRNMDRLLALLARAGRRLAPRGLPLMLPVPGGGQPRQPVHVADVAGAVLAAVDRPAAWTRCYDIAGPEPMTFAELLHASGAAIGCRVRVVPVPSAPVTAFIRCCERVGHGPGILAEQWAQLGEDNAFRLDAAVRDLRYAPRSFADGIRAEAAALGLASGPPARAAPVPRDAPVPRAAPVPRDASALGDAPVPGGVS